MGQPGGSDSSTVQRTGRTRGTETSKYPEEKKTNSDSASSGERTRQSPNRSRSNAASGVVGPSTKRHRKVSRTGWKAGPQRVKAP